MYPVPDMTTRITPPDGNDFDDQFIDGLRRDIDANRLVLPSLPDVAQKVRHVVEDADATTQKVAGLISTDAAMSARLLKVANSPLYRRTGAAIDDVGTAVTRLGLSLVRTLIVNLSIVQVMRPTQGIGAKYLQQIFAHSLAVAIWSYALAARYTRLSPDEAMLAGMIHDIGYLPILQHAAKQKDLMDDEAALTSLLRRHHADVGATVLKAWNFGSQFIHVACEHEDVYRTGEAEPTLVDLVIAAELYAGHEMGPAPMGVDPSRVPALRKLGLARQGGVPDDPQVLDFLEQAQQILNT
jgi:putative nucleotidyltransferase with HDIG domain